MKKLITALLLAALVLSGCVKEENPTENDVDTTESTPETETTPAETEPETEAAPDPGSPVKFSLDEIPKGEVYFTVCRHIRGGNLYIKTDALLAEYSPDKLENYCYYIPYGDSPEILETAEGGGAFVVDDNGLRLVVIDGGVYELPFEEYKSKAEYESISFVITLDKISGEVSGVIEYARKPDEAINQYFYSIAADKVTIHIGEYDNLSQVTRNGHIMAHKQEDPHSPSQISREIDIATGEVVHQFDGCAGSVCNEAGLFYGVDYDSGPSVIIYDEVYNSDYEKIAESDRGFATVEINSEGNLVLIGRNVSSDEESAERSKTFSVIDKNGSEVYKSKEFTDALYGTGDFIYVIEGNDLNLYDYKGNFIYTLAKTVDSEKAGFISFLCDSFDGKSFEANSYSLGYYKNTGTAAEPEYTLDESKTYIDAGIYIYIEAINEDVGLPGAAAEFIYYPKTGESGVIAMAEEAAVAKPVLYLYPEEECEVNVTFAHPDRLNVVYPAYDVTTGWNITAKPDGTLTDEAGRNYYALYWDEKGAITPDWNEGFSVKREDASSFLEEKLAEIGLTWREVNEFIMYWLPYFEKNEYTLVWFEFTESREAENKLHIIPEPDSLLRFSIHLKGSDADVDLPGQKIPAFDRVGFTAIEWGGTYHE